MMVVEVNGKRETVSLPPDTPLLWVLRDELGLRGTKYCCGTGDCGVCTVHLDGEAAHACRVPLKAVEGRKVTTIEGLVQAGHGVLEAWYAERVPQCGYCQPGQLMTAAALLNRNPRPSGAEVAKAMSSVLCRCGTYPRIRNALRRVVEGLPGIETLPPPLGELSDPGIALNPWVRISPSGRVTLLIDRSEMGQGALTGLVLLLCEELEVEPSEVRTEFAPAGDQYRNPMLGAQMTGGSTSVRAAWRPLREAGAAARERLIAAAAERWGVAPEECSVEGGTVIHPLTGRRLGYGELASRAAELPPPPAPILKSPDAFRLVGKSYPPLDLLEKIEGRCVFGVDVSLPGARVAMIARCPVPGGRPRRVDASAAEAVEGVERVVSVPSGVAVVARDVWSARQGRAALKVVWDEGELAQVYSGGIRADLLAGLERRGRAAHVTGDAAKMLQRAPRVLEARYETPYLAHVPLEAGNCTVRIDSDGCDVWLPTQDQSGAQDTVMELSGLPQEAVRIHSTFLGGGFGRRLEQDVVAEAVEVAKAVRHPVQLVWSLDDEIAHDFYRPANMNLLQAALDAQGFPAAWFQRTAGPALSLGSDIPYAIPHLREEQVEVDPGIPAGAWRSVAASQNAFAVECFVDELAHAARADPLEYRLRLLAEAPRHRAVLETAAERAGWGTPLPPGSARGIAVYRSYGSWVAEVAEVSLGARGAVAVHRIVCAADCGTVVNPDGVAAQMEGGIVFGLTAALKGEITFSAGRAEQSGFDDYPLLTFAETPPIEVVLMPSREPPGGAGEPGVPPVAPAVANAIFAASGKRLRLLPLRMPGPD